MAKQKYNDLDPKYKSMKPLMDKARPENKIFMAIYAEGDKFHEVGNFDSENKEIEKAGDFIDRATALGTRMEAYQKKLMHGQSNQDFEYDYVKEFNSISEGYTTLLEDYDDYNAPVIETQQERNLKKQNEQMGLEFEKIRNKEITILLQNIALAEDYLKVFARKYGNNHQDYKAAIQKVAELKELAKAIQEADYDLTAWSPYGSDFDKAFDQTKAPHLELMTLIRNLQTAEKYMQPAQNQMPFRDKPDDLNEDNQSEDSFQSFETRDSFKSFDNEDEFFELDSANDTEESFGGEIKISESDNKNPPDSYYESTGSDSGKSKVKSLTYFYQAQNSNLKTKPSNDEKSDKEIEEVIVNPCSMTKDVTGKEKCRDLAKSTLAEALQCGVKPSLSTISGTNEYKTATYMVCMQSKIEFDIPAEGDTNCTIYRIAQFELRNMRDIDKKKYEISNVVGKPSSNNDGPGLNKL